MIDQWLSQLQDPDPEKRKQAIIALGRSKDPAAVRPLAEVFQNDTSAENRELARKAAQYIRQQTGGTAPAASAPPPSEPPSTPAPRRSLRSLADAASSSSRPSEPISSPPPVPQADVYGSSAPASGGEDLLASIGVTETPSEGRKLPIPVRGREYNVNKENRDRAKSLTDGALSAQMSGDNGRALKMLAQAISLNPNLINDQFYNSVAGEVTGREGDSAIQMIVDSQQRKGFVNQATQAKKQARVQKQLEKARETKWDAVWFEVVIYLLIAALGPIIMIVLTVEMFRSSITPEMLETPAVAEALPPDMDILINGVNFGILLLVGGVSAVMSVISLFIQGGVIHLLAKAFRAVGTFPHLMTVLLRFYNRFLPILFVILSVVVILSILTLGSPIPVCGALVISIFSLYMFFRTAGTIGEAYDQGAGFGCIMLLLSGLVLAVVNYLVTSALTGVISNMILGGA